MLPLILMTLASLSPAPAVDTLAADTALLASLALDPAQLRPLALDTVLVAAGKAAAVICHADAPPWREAAGAVQEAIKAATGVELPLLTDAQLTPEQADSQNVILLGHLDNNRHVARLYHNFFVCLDVGYTGRKGYVIRSVQDPFGRGHNSLLVGGSYPEGTRLGAQAFADLVKANGKPGTLTLGRLLELKFDPNNRQEKAVAPLTDEQRDAAIDAARTTLFSPGEGRSGVARMLDFAVRYHRTGDVRAAEAYRALLLALMEYYAKDQYINSEGLARYDRDFRDSWTHGVAITWDLLEETGLFSDAERLAVTNFLVRLGLECVRYQGWNRPETLERWSCLLKRRSAASFSASGT
ncbi:MAG: hypothetical protein CO096_09915 [Armatimonadetes bacterium CG_4_9_14_3_um_filter_66_14]|nr:hypothetical protein [Armatimonadota bacterium]PIU91650.1 MAG: hypothetical protein COS65_21330 [Armatimonadetes bacterium CG06_land_8_20_14_3_00_66_21]PJB71329.1 MAG: hypothetical protein CO096_09915 [Armatimonadetes bacterium CG_4_9_14_3_um_filter_66_14]